MAALYYCTTGLALVLEDEDDVIYRTVLLVAIFGYTQDGNLTDLNLTLTLT